MNQNLSIAEQVEFLMTEREIRKVVLDYCSTQDKRKLKEFMDLFTEDCHFSYPGVDIRGRDNLREFYVTEIFSHNEFCFHACYNIDIEIDQDKASVEAYYGVKTSYDGDPQEGYGRYLFNFVKVTEKWKISKLKCTFCLWNGTLAPEDASVYERFWFDDEIKAKFQKGS